MKTDAISLWYSRNAHKPQTPALQRMSNGEESLEAERINRLRVVIGELRLMDNSIAYGQSLLNGGLIGHLLFAMDQQYLDFTSFSDLWRYILDIRVVSWQKDTMDQLRSKLEVLHNRRQMLLSLLGKSIRGQADVDSQIHSALPRNDLIRPSIISSVIIPSVGYGIVAVTVGRFLMGVDWQFYVDFSVDLWSVGKNLFKDWIWNPLREVWRTIRYRDSNLAIVSAAALQSDMDSLERMVLAFVAKHQIASDNDSVIDAVKQGDVSVIMRQYEEEIQRPLKSLLMGDLMTLMLIQVQKSKVDMESAMVAIDKLLKSNELTFELLAIVPLLGVLWLVTRQGKSILRDWMRRGEKAFALQLREIFRSIRVVNSRSLTPSLSSDDHDIMLGELVLLCQSFLEVFHQLPSKTISIFEETLYEDLGDLLSSSMAMTCSTIDRMVAFYPFLHPAQ